MKNLKKISLGLILVLASQFIFAQTHPQIGNLKGINYQAVAIDENGKQIVGMDINGKPLYEKTIGVRFSILKGASGNTEYQETQTAQTDKYGLFSVVIGAGTQTGAGQFSSLMMIPWIDADQWLKVEIATKNDGNYKLVSLQQFMSVPYSFYTNDIADNAITTYKILDSTIVNQDIHTSAVDSRTILDSTIINQDIHTSAVDSRVILDYSILNQDIKTSAVDSRTILDSTILNQDIHTSAVDSRAILDYSILNQDIKTSAVDTRTILDSTILNQDIHTGAIDSRAILDGSILNQDIANGTINLTTKVTGILPVPNGGTGVSSSTNGGVLIGGGTTQIRSVTHATDSTILVGLSASDPIFKHLASGAGIIIRHKADSIIVSSGVTGVNSVTAPNVSPGTVATGTTWVSGPLTLTGVVLGNIIVGSINGDLKGCMMTCYVSGNNQMKVAIFNGTGSPVNFNSSGGIYTLKVLVVQ